MAASWLAKRCSAPLEPSTKAVRSSSRSASSSESRRKLWIERLMLSRRWASPPLSLATSRAKGSNWRKALEALRPRPCSGSSALGAGGQQQLQEGLGVRVERGEDLVGVDVGLGRGERDRRALLDAGAVLGARVDLDHHVVEAGLRAQQQRGVLLDQLGLVVVDLHRHLGLAVLEIDRRDVADLDAGDDHRLALARRHGLGRGELGVDLEPLLAEDRDPGRERAGLVAEDDEGGDDAGDDEPDDRQEVAQVLSDRAPHGTATGLGGPSAARGPFRLGIGFVWQATSSL